VNKANPPSGKPLRQSNQFLHLRAFRYMYVRLEQSTRQGQANETTWINHHLTYLSPGIDLLGKSGCLFRPESQRFLGECERTHGSSATCRQGFQLHLDNSQAKLSPAGQCALDFLRVREYFIEIERIPMAEF